MYVLLTALVTLLTSDLLTLVFIGCFALFVLRITSIDRYFSPRRRVNVHAGGGLSVAEHLGSGIVRHGKTPAEALANLHGVFDPTAGAEETG